MFDDERLYVDEENVDEVLRETMDQSPVLRDVPVEDVVDDFKNTFYDEIEGAYAFTVTSYHEWINRKVQEIIDDTLRDMVKRGLLDMGPDENGEIVFWATEKGKRALE